MNKIITATIIFTASLFASCQKDIDLFIPNGTTSGIDTNWISIPSSSSPVTELKHSLVREPALDSIDCGPGGIINNTDGLSLNLTPLSLVLPNGVSATGKIYAETMLINKKGDMVKMDRPTTSNNRILISGGEVYVKFRKDNEELHLAPNKKIYFKYPDPSPSFQMSIFYGDESNPNQFNWIPSYDSSGVFPSTQNQFIGYEAFANNLRWINVDRFTDSSGQRINIIASLPVDYTNANTVVYVIFHDQKSVINMYGDPIIKKFISGRIPVGRLVTVLSITKKGANSYYLSHENITTGQSGTVSGQTVPLHPVPTSLADIKTYLATL